MNLRRRLALLIFPFAELVLFSFAVLSLHGHPVVTIAWLCSAGLALCLSVHICFHEMVHATGPEDSFTRLLSAYAATLMQGMPFDGYRCHHYNHHRHSNNLEDYSSTWEASPAGPQAQTWWRYALLWPRQILKARADMRAQGLEGRLPRWIQRRIRREKWALILTMTGLGIVSWKALLLYVGVIYCGWALVALYNYRQHPPSDPREAILSYRGAFYNFIFCNNGLHREHHAQPDIPWHALKAGV